MSCAASLQQEAYRTAKDVRVRLTTTSSSVSWLGTAYGRGSVPAWCHHSLPACDRPPRAAQPPAGAAAASPPRRYGQSGVHGAVQTSGKGHLSPTRSSLKTCQFTESHVETLPIRSVKYLETFTGSYKEIKRKEGINTIEEHESMDEAKPSQECDGLFHRDDL
jgi:hypothetical protein